MYYSKQSLVIRKTKVSIFSENGAIVEERWFDKEGRTHRANGLPSVVREEDRYEAYYIHGELKHWISNGEITYWNTGYEESEWTDEDGTTSMVRFSTENGKEKHEEKD